MMRKKELIKASLLIGVMIITPNLAPAAVDTAEPPPIDNQTPPDTLVIPANVAMDADGIPYPTGGPEDLYEAIEIKQVQLKINPDHYGHQNAISRLRRNLERVLKELNLTDDVPDNPETPEAIDDPETIDTPANVAMDADGNQYPEGGAPGLYRAIENHQARLETDSDNPELNDSLNHLRNNLEKQLEKRGIPMDVEPGVEVEAV
ncbi:MAG: hypothetical protein ABFR63_11225, partial [Thermodesulfobacteriota bacterium]